MAVTNAVEIRWHGRGGQGAKTACLLLAEAAFDSGKYVQGFPEYGPERQGAPITAYNRITESPCKVHSNIYKPDYVVVVDETLLNTVDVTAGLSEDGAIIINSEKDVEELRPMLRGYKGQVCALNARKIAEDNLGKNYPNTPMLDRSCFLASPSVKPTVILEGCLFLTMRSSQSTIVAITGKTAVNTATVRQLM